MGKPTMVTLISQSAKPGERVPRQRVVEVLTALRFLEDHGHVSLVYELYRLCQQPQQKLTTSQATKLREEGLIERCNPKTGAVKLDPTVQAIVLVAVTYVGPYRIRLAKRLEDIIQR